MACNLVSLKFVGVLVWSEIMIRFDSLERSASFIRPNRKTKPVPISFGCFLLLFLALFGSVVANRSAATQESSCGDSRHYSCCGAVCDRQGQRFLPRGGARCRLDRDAVGCGDTGAHRWQCEFFYTRRSGTSAGASRSADSAFV